MASVNDTRHARSRQHVLQAQQRIEEQLARIETLIADGHDPQQAELLLATYMPVMDTLEEHLAMLERHAAGAKP